MKSLRMHAYALWITAILIFVFHSFFERFASTPVVMGVAVFLSVLGSSWYQRSGR